MLAFQCRSMEVVLSQPTRKVSVAKSSTGTVLLIHGARDLDRVLRPLVDAGYQVVCVESSKRGLEEAMKGKFHVVLCDSISRTVRSSTP